MGIFDLPSWKQYVDGYAIVDCVLMDPERIFLVLTEEQDSSHRDILSCTRFLFIKRHREIGQGRFTLNECGHFDFPKMAYANREFLGVDLHGHVFRYDAHSTVYERPGIDTSWLDGKRHPAVTRVKRVFDTLYVLALDRLIYVREGPDEWSLFPGLERPKQRLRNGYYGPEFGFDDIDAFAPDDMYAVGGYGDVWRYDGMRWRQCAFPSKEVLRTVCCAGNGRVYISGNMGSLWVGRGDEWERLAEGAFTVPFRDTLWFSGMLWCGSCYGVWTLDEANRLERAPVPDDVMLTSGALDISPDGRYLLTAGNHGASLFDGERWEVLFNDLDFEP